MLGHKESLRRLLRVLRCLGIRASRSTRFVQGRTMRWGLAWTLREDAGKPIHPTDKVGQRTPATIPIVYL